MKILFLLFCFYLLSGCTDSPKGSTANEGSAPPVGNSELSSIFPYEFKFDTVAYMSCETKANISHPKGVFFTFKVGAYKPGAGLRLSSGFVNATRGKSFFKQKNAFESAYNTKASRKGRLTLQLALRGATSSTIERAYPIAGSGVRGLDYAIFLYSSYGAEKLLSQLLNFARLDNRPYLQYEKGVPPEASLGSHRYFEQSLGKVGLSPSKISKLNDSEYRLSSLYTNREDYISSNTKPAVIKGKSFEMEFAAVGRGEGDLRKLVDLKEHIVGGGEDESEWACGSYQVMRDRDRGHCDIPVSETPNSPIATAMENVWGATGFWKFNHAKKCAVYQLKGSLTTQPERDNQTVCYNERSLGLAKTRRATVCYNKDKDKAARNKCNKNEKGGGVAYQNDLVPGNPSIVGDKSFCDSSDPENAYHCPHFLSACWRE